jgi:hypothetical protein
VYNHQCYVIFSSEQLQKLVRLIAKMQACEIHTREKRHAHEMYAHKVHAYEMHVCEIHAYEMLAHEMQAYDAHVYREGREDGCTTSIGVSQPPGIAVATIMRAFGYAVIHFIM